MGDEGSVNGAAVEPRPLGQVIVTSFDTGGLRVATSPGLTPDVAERMLYGALKHLERQMLLLGLRQMVEQPRIVSALGGLPRPPA